MEWNLKEAMQMREAGMAWEKLGKHFGISYEVARRRCDPVYRAKRVERNRVARRDDLYGKAPTQRLHIIADGPANKNPILPPKYDLRSLTSRICGDPYPGRSALDRQERQP